MIHHNQIVFILGAGASQVYGLPSSTTLLEKVRDDQSEGVRVALSREKVIDHWDRVCEFQKLLEQGIVFSIDRFLETRSTPERAIGKALIAHELLKCETFDNLYGRGRLLQYYQDDWVRWLLNYMKAESLDAFLNNRVSFVTFNYDHSLETLLLGAIRARYSADIEWAAITTRIPVVHLYGSLGINAYERANALHNDAHTADAIRQAARSIQIISDSTIRPDSEAFSRAYELFGQADLIVFLGFGFDARNVERLQLHEHVKTSAKMVGTAMGFYDAELTHDVLGAFDQRIRERVRDGLQDQSNVDLLRNHRNLFT